GGVTFAAFPATYAVLFSSLYTPLLLLLFALIFRGVSFEFRRKVDSDSWRKFWDGCNVLGSFLPALLFGVAFANIFMGIPTGPLLPSINRKSSQPWNPIGIPELRPRNTFW
ncbi:MAG: cytochrome d ubiquinol oxidase subunit II, partial [Desulfovibrionales bacterium]|nr:cytochrome d ubiquinol oxidase subunit II [Desulfovibrionales bacterium]